MYVSRKKTETLVVASKETSLKIIAEKTKDMVVSRDHHEGQNHNVQRGWNISETWE
jgi:hypothetical protein